ncbi:hypothetical protein AB3Y40_04525 [Yoonia sp. R2331]|uniref:hypothetical protein n=1 Tax=Yoonia sp. R2331 TaxID=3237238 RepID=UPI0034E5350D
MVRLILLLITLAAPVAAETPMTAKEFDTYATGRTLTFGLADGTVFGVEQYLPDRRVIWSRMDGTCTDGFWYAHKSNICFVYENDPEPKCWEIFRTANGIRADFANQPGTTVLFEAIEDPAALICGNLLS